MTVARVTVARVIVRMYDLYNVILAANAHVHSRIGFGTVQGVQELRASGSESRGKSALVRFLRYGLQWKLRRFTLVRHVHAQLGRADGNVGLQFPVEQVDVYLLFVFDQNQLSVEFMLANLQQFAVVWSVGSVLVLDSWLLPP